MPATSAKLTGICGQWSQSKLEAHDGEDKNQTVLHMTEVACDCPQCGINSGEFLEFVEA